MFLGIYLFVVTAILFNFHFVDSRYHSSIGITEVDGKKFWIGNRFKVNVHEARRFCQLYGMDLISIQDETKYKTVMTLLQGSAEEFWTSGNKINDHVNWVWSRGEPVTLNKWAPGEPNNVAKNEWCFTLRVGRFVDLPCEWSYYFLCESVDICENCTRNENPCTPPSGCKDTQQPPAEQRVLTNNNCPQIQPVVYVTVNTNGNNANVDASHNTTTAVKRPPCFSG